MTEATEGKGYKCTLRFGQPVGKSVPGGPYQRGEVYKDCGPEVYNHPLIKALITNGKVLVLGDIDKVADEQLSKALADMNRKTAIIDKAIAAINEIVEQIHKAAADNDVPAVDQLAEEAKKAAEEAKKAAEEAEKKIVDDAAERAKKEAADAKKAADAEKNKK